MGFHCWDHIRTSWSTSICCGLPFHEKSTHETVIPSWPTSSNLSAMPISFAPCSFTAFGLSPWAWLALCTAFLCWTDCRFLTRKFLFSMPVLWRRVLQAIAYGQASLIASAVKPFYRSWSLPSTLIPIVWIFNAPDSYYLVPVALILSGIFFSGIGVGISPLVYSLLPQGEKRTLYLASWSVAVNLMGALGPFLGGVLAYQLQDVRWEWMGFPITNLQIIFAISAGARIVPMLLLRGVRDTKDTTSRELISQMRRGNLLSYAYNTALFNIASREKS